VNGRESASGDGELGGNGWINGGVKLPATMDLRVAGDAVPNDDTPVVLVADVARRVAENRGGGGRNAGSVDDDRGGK
jgi:hypothetical protein